MPSLKSFVALSILTIITGYVGAQQSTTNELQTTSERIAVLEVRLKELELENKVAQQASDLAQRGQGAKKNSSSLDSYVDYGTPTVALVEGIKGSLEAVLVYRGNVRQRVKEGDSVYGALVKRISINEVTLVDQKSKVQQRLQFSSANITRESSASGVPGAPLPPSMPAGYPPAVR